MGSSTEWFPVGSTEVLQMFIEAIKGVLYETVQPPPLDLLSQMPAASAPPTPSTESQPVVLASTHHPEVSRKDEIAKLEEELIELLGKSSSSSRLLEVDWVYVIDSGGQPQFHEVLPAFVRNASGVIFVSKLNEQLNECPKVDYYNEEGQKCGSSYSSLFTHEQILRHCFRAMQSRLCMSKANSPTIFVVGSHKDVEYECRETRAQKDARLQSMLRPIFRSNLAFYRVSKPEKLIFPVNAKTPGEEDRKVAEELRKAVMQQCKEDPIKIPMPWFVFEQFVRRLASERDTSLLSIEECRRISRRLHMREDSFQAALHYLVKLNIFLYYPELLPGVVFCESQVLLDKVSELVEFSHILRGTSDKPCSDLHLGGGFECLKFRDYGIITVGLLKEFPKHYVEGLFTSHDLLKLLNGRLLVAQITSTEHIMPCVLPELSPHEISTYQRLDPKSPATPLLIRSSDNWIPSGVFTVLIAFLQNEAHWQVVLKDDNPVCLYRNCVKFGLPTGKRGVVTLIDSFEYLEVYVQAGQRNCSKLCPQIRHEIFEGLQRAADTLGYDGLTLQVAFFCLQRDICCNTTLHPAHLADDEWVCTVNPEVGGELNNQHRVWFDDSGLQHSSTKSTGSSKSVCVYNT